jgi:peptidoglycan L-alanyl-D-glutamate endopeptidase CwlK
MKAAVEKLLTAHPEVFLTETYRTKERQDYVYSLGRTIPGKVVTWVKHSLHQDGVAVDIGFKGAELYPKDIAKWQKVADTARALGLDWLYALYGEDKPHFQLSKTPPPIPDEPLDWAARSWEKAVEKGIVTKDPHGELDNAALELILQRLGIVSQLQGGMSRERFVFILDKLKLL